MQIEDTMLQQSCLTLNEDIQQYEGQLPITEEHFSCQYVGNQSQANFHSVVFTWLSPYEGSLHLTDRFTLNFLHMK